MAYPTPDLDAYVILSDIMAFLSLRHDGAEYPFWDKFFKYQTVNEDWSANFKLRTAGEPRFISWDFMKGYVHPNASGFDQYLQAVKAAQDICASDGIPTKENLRELYDLAQTNLRARQSDHARYPVKPDNKVWKHHHTVISYWESLVEAIETVT